MEVGAASQERSPPSWLGPAPSLLWKVSGPRRAALVVEVSLERSAQTNGLASLHLYSLAYDLSAYGGVHA
jgi:hypothetical protein